MSSTAPTEPTTPGLCHGCGEPIVSPSFLRAGKYTFHSEHFVCEVCKKSLIGHKPRIKDDKFYCNEDFTEKFCQVCSACGEKIAEGTLVKVSWLVFFAFFCFSSFLLYLSYYNEL